MKTILLLLGISCYTLSYASNFTINSDVYIVYLLILLLLGGILGITYFIKFIRRKLNESHEAIAENCSTD
jgi:hypothetical protein